MGKRGPKSTDELSTIVPFPSREPRRPPAPRELAKAEALEWRAVVDRLPADWFPRETWGLLTQYCRHVVRARHVAGLLEKAWAASVGIPELDRLLKMQER